MAFNNKVLLLLIIGIFRCNSVSWRRQLEHIAKTRLENKGLLDPTPARRFYKFDPRELSAIIGVPSQASHLPEAEPVLPGHTLLRPALGMLKSALKFPHRELEDGSGVYGNVDNLGIKYDSRNERLMYSGFRRFPSDYIMVIPSPSQVKYEKPRFKLESAVLDMDRQAKAKNEIVKILKKLNMPALKGVRVFVATENGKYLVNLGSSSAKESSYYLNENAPEKVKGVLRTQLENIKLSNPSQYMDSPEFDEHRSSVSTPGDNHLKSEEEKKKNEKKSSWLNKMNTFDHIKIIQEAPEMDEFMPPITDTTIRKWWFYHADDYQPFSRERHK